MSDVPKVWLRPPHGQGAPEQVEAKPDLLIPRMVSGWSQCEPPEAHAEVKSVHD